MIGSTHRAKMALSFTRKHAEKYRCRICDLVYDNVHNMRRACAARSDEVIAARTRRTQSLETVVNDASYMGYTAYTVTL